MAAIRPENETNITFITRGMYPSVTFSDDRDDNWVCTGNDKS